MFLDYLRHVVRRVWVRPGVTLAAAGILALGIGLVTAMFVILDALVLRPVPFRAPDQLAQIYMGKASGGRLTVAPAVLRAWRESAVFAGVEAALADTAVIDHDGAVASKGIARITPGLLPLLGDIKPVQGRLFEPSDGRAGLDDRVLLSEDVWRGLYHADPALVGRRVTIDAERLLVVGILPSEFRFPSWNTAIWRPSDFSRADDRPKAYVRFARATPRADSLRRATEVARAVDGAAAELQARVRPLAGTVLDPYYRRAVPLLAGGVILVFLVLCANVSSLLLANLIARGRQFRTCMALGASRRRLMCEALGENCVIASLAFAGGLGASWTLVSAAHGLLPQVLLFRTLNPLNIDFRAVGVASAAAVVVVLVAGFVPVWLGSRIADGHVLRVTDQGGTETRRARAFARGLVVGEVAVACTLLVGATLLVRSFINLAGVERGLDASGVITAAVSLPKPVFQDRLSRAVVMRSLEEHVRQLPAVEQVAWSYGLPPDLANFSEGKWTSDAARGTGIEMTVQRYNVGPEFFQLYRVPLLDGRTFEVSDTAGEVVVGERFARALWPGLSPVGHTFRWDKEQFHVIGVVSEINYPSLDPELDRPEFYQRFTGVGSSAMMSIRCAGPCPDAAVIRSRLMSTHAAVLVLDVRRPEDVYLEQLAKPRAAAALGFTFAGIAMVAAATGLFAVLRHAVRRRRREFGIRMAVGASPSQVRWLLLRDGVLIALVGMAIGTVAAWALGRALASLQYGVSLRDPFTWGIVLGVLAVTSVAASWRPAREAMLLDPAVLLREE